VRRALAAAVQEPYIADHVDLAVSHGAAILAASLIDVTQMDLAPGEMDYAPVEIQVRDVVSHPISVGLKDNGILICFPTIIKNTTLPATGMTLGAAPPYSKLVALPVYRGGESDPNRNVLLGDLTVEIDTPSALRLPLRYDLRLNNDGILEVEGGEVDLTGLDLGTWTLMEPARLKVKRKFATKIVKPNLLGK
jgi:hypothetical protein